MNNLLQMVKGARRRNRSRWRNRCFLGLDIGLGAEGGEGERGELGLIMGKCSPTLAFDDRVIDPQHRTLIHRLGEQARLAAV